MTKRIKEKAAILRRDKETPRSDFWHTLQLGVPIAVVLYLILPLVFRFFIE